MSINSLLSLIEIIKSILSLKDKREACLRNWIRFLDQKFSKDDFLRLKSKTEKLYPKYFGSKKIRKRLEKVMWSDLNTDNGKNPNHIPLEELISAMGNFLKKNSDEISDMLHKPEQIDWSKHFSFFPNS
ncbi:MAG: hypothetical protein EBS06_04240 [Proteobacteria bacterium]|nr:hypothetical protein [Pseudomonadota bacterium]